MEMLTQQIGSQGVDLATYYVLVKLAVNLDSADRTWNASSLPELDDSC